MSNILITEDEDILVRSLQDNLAAEGYTIDTAMNGEEAVEKIKKNKPDLILLDLLMPKKDGFYVLGELKNNPEWKSIPVIVLSNLGEDTSIKRAMEMGANDYFVKSQHPIDEVIKKVKEYLKK
jgi:DNA-binding response OmpR family regulator